MRDKITKAIDALASAAFIEGGVSAEKTQTARDLTEQRKRELVEAISSPCLHQISEPSVNQQLTVAPVAAMTNALREAEAALEVALARILKADPGHSTSVTSEAKALVAVRQALSAKAAPVAVGEREAFERELIDNHHYVPSDFSFKDGFYGGDDDYIQFGWDIWQARAALAATPAEPRHEAAVILEAIAQEPPINGNEIAKARTLMAARALRAATQAAVPAIPKWIDDPHDIEQGQMLNPEWVKLQEAATPADHSEQDLKMVKAAPVVLPEPWGYLVEGRIFIGRLLPQHVSSMVDAEGFEPTKLYTEPQMHALLATGGQAQAFQQRVQPWMMACFGPEISADVAERNHRFLEEALELVQACGCTASEAHQLVDYVFGRPVGDKQQEVGGVMVTLAALCLAQGLDMHAAGEVELARIWTKVEAIRAKQAAKPKHSPLPEHAPQAQADARDAAPAALAKTLTFAQWWTGGGRLKVAEMVHSNGWRGAAEAGYSAGVLQVAPAASEQDAARYRFIVENKLILSGGTEKFGWPIAPFGSECDRYIDAAIAAAKGE